MKKVRLNRMEMEAVKTALRFYSEHLRKPIEPCSGTAIQLRTYVVDPLLRKLEDLFKDDR
jgi:hypothetical protein